MAPVVHVETDRLILRRPTAADAVAFVEIQADPATLRFNPAGALTAALAREAMAADDAHWQVHGDGLGAACMRGAPAVAIGFGGIARRPFGGVARTNLGFRFAASAWGRGYGTELAVAALDVGFRLRAFDDVWASVRENNLAWRHVIEKIGMTCVERVVDARDEVAASLWYAIEAPAASKGVTGVQRTAT